MALLDNTPEGEQEQQGHQEPDTSYQVHLHGCATHGVCYAGFDRGNRATEKGDGEGESQHQANMLLLIAVSVSSGEIRTPIAATKGRTIRHPQMLGSVR